MNHLIVVAHPDDEVLGAGATIHKLTQAGNRVAICTMSNNVAARVGISDTLSVEQNEALRILGVENVCCQFPQYRNEHSASSGAGSVHRKMY